MKNFIANNSQYEYNFTDVLSMLPSHIMLAYGISALAIILNAFVLFILLKLGIISNAFNLLILNLSLSDLLKSFAIIIGSNQAADGARSITMSNSTLASWNIICKVNYFSMLSANFSATLTLTVLSIERFRAIYYPLDTRSDYKHYVIVIVFIWIISFGASSYTIVSYHIIPIHPYFCLLNGQNFLNNNVWMITTGFICCFIPVTITCICYIMIAFKSFRCFEIIIVCKILVI